MVAVIAARNEAGRVGPTVESVRAVAGVTEVVVASDGSTDGTEAEARASGARVVTARRARGKGAALEAALTSTGPAHAYLLVDGDVAGSAREAGRLLEEVLSGRADLAIGVLPRDPRHGGFRIVKRSAAAVIRALSGFRAREPLSGQRALSGRAMDLVRPLAAGFGVEVAMTVDAVRAGLRVVEVPVAMEHRPTGRDARGFLHRGRQGWAVLRVAASRAFRRP